VRKGVVGWLLVLFWIGLGACTLAQSPTVGVPDNGDFWRVLDPTGLRHSQAAAPGHVDARYQRVPPRLGLLTSSSSLLAYAARAIDCVRGAADFDLRVMGLCGFALLAAAIVVLALHPADRLLAAALAYLACDPNNLLPFNSFHSDPLYFVAFVWVVVLLVRSARLGVTPLLGTGLLGAALVGGCSKPQHMLLPALAAAAVLLGALRWRERPRAWLLAPLLFAATLVPVGYHVLRDRPGLAMPAHMNQYNMVFTGACQVSDHPERVLVELGLPAEAATYCGRSFFAGPPGRIVRASQDVSRLRLAWVYLRDRRAWMAARDLTLSYLASSRLTLAPTDRAFTRPRDALLARWRFLAWLLPLSTVLVLFNRPRPTPYSVVAMFAVLTLGAEVVVAVLGDGLATLHRHLWGARIAIDVLLLIACGQVVVGLRRGVQMLSRVRRMRDGSAVLGV
jgi:hypothetical protein